MKNLDEKALDNAIYAARGIGWKSKRDMITAAIQAYLQAAQPNDVDVLPYDVDVGNGLSFGKGVALTTFIAAFTRCRKYLMEAHNNLHDALCDEVGTEEELAASILSDAPIAELQRENAELRHLCEQALGSLPNDKMDSRTAMYLKQALNNKGAV